MTPEALLELPLTEAADAFRRGEVTAARLLDAALGRIRHAQGLTNAVLRLDEAAARMAAFAADRARAKGEAPGPLAGVPLLHKDMFDRAGHATTAGSVIWRDRIARRTATVLERLDAAGALDLGRLNMAEFAQNGTGHNRPYGDARNPWNGDYCTGGSSSGSGAAVAARMCWGALGSDTGGSIRLPAAMCGISGLKPTQGRVPRTGAMPLSFSCDNVGPMARTARDLARLLGVLAGRCAGDPASSALPAEDYEAALDGDLRGLRIGVIEPMAEGCEEEVRRAFDAALDAWRARGALLRGVAPASLKPAATYTALVSRSEGAMIHAQWMRERPADYAPHLSARIYAGYAVPAAAYAEALARRGGVLRAFCAEAFREHDILLAPTLRTPVPSRAETDVDADPANWPRMMGVSANTRVFNYLGLPVASIPCGFDGRGLPVGLQVIGRPFAEAAVLRAADAFQRETDWHLRAPPL
ncbi:amidase [Roseococcus sp. DSY-14]|uniref:amidase n=1 Tax=Roseococcus sp. DSY-14 TaxID=3369650 RepID=UPI00387AFCC2